DSDCDGVSDYDADSDGYDSEAYEGDDCDDADPEVNPDATETWYDGIDEDCDAGDDYDADGDGDRHDDYGGNDCDDTEGSVYWDADEACDGVDNDCDEKIPTDEVDEDGDLYLACEECDDDDGSVNPGATDDWYDGVDADCDGSEDYDADEDGFVTDEHEGLTTLYVDGSGELPAGDCDDEDDAEPFVADPTDGSASGSGTWDDPLDSLQDAIDY
ncbi:MAG: MopE-related protein, partial [Myxococcota bacterium]|nr:MopE-related protein [Myxococcota bacterium]